MDLIQKATKTILAYKLFTDADKVIVAVSGGPDSVFLLYLLYRLRYPLGIRLHVAHLNHLLRKDAQKDEQFVSTLARKLKLPFTGAAVKIQKRKNKSSIEELARQARMDFLMRLARKQKADTIALGHTQDDLAETVLMRIVRGTGLAGLRAIVPKRRMNGFNFVRPLLEINKSDIMQFLKRRKVPFCVDSTNTKTDFFRNKIRLKLIPFLESGYNRNIKTGLANLSRSIALDYDFLNQQAEQQLQRLTHKEKNRNSLKIEFVKFKKYHKAIQRNILRLIIERLTGDTRQLTFNHIHEIEDLMENRPAGSVVNLPKNLLILKQQKFLRVTALQ